MDKIADFCREAGYPEIAREYEHMKKYGHLTLPQTAELLDRYETALKQIRDHYTDTPLAAKHMAAFAGAALGAYVPVSSHFATGEDDGKN